MSRLAADWGEWASDCDARAERPAAVESDPVVTITASANGRELWCQRVSVATGKALSADVVPLSTRRTVEGDA